MYKGRIPALFVRCALPQMVGLLFNSVYLIVDGVFIGNRLGREAMAAAAVAVPLMEILIALSIAVSAGGGVLVSGCLARGEREGAGAAFHGAVRICAIMGLLFAGLGTVFTEQAAAFLGATAENRPMAVAYMRWIFLFSPFQIFSFLLGGMARNDGCPRLAMFALAFGSLSNILLDYVFMYPLNMGITGAALATGIGPVFSVLILLPHFLFGKGALRFGMRKIGWRLPGRILKMGLPSFVMEFSIGIVKFIYNLAVVHLGYGEVGLAAYLLIGYLMLILLTLFLGMAEGLQPVFSYLQGAGDSRRNAALLRFSAGVFLAVGGACLLLVALGSGAFYRLFASGDPAVLAMAQSHSLPYFCGIFASGFNILMISCDQSTGQTRHAMLTAILRSTLIPVACMLILPPMWGREAAWYAFSLGEMGAALVSLGRFRRQIRI